jgi:hypothetical protein
VAAPKRRQWHHKASTALGFHPPRRHLSAKTSIALIVAAVLVLLAIPVTIIGVTGGFDRPVETPQPVAPSSPAPGEAGATAWSLGRDFASGDFTLELVAYEDALAALAEDGSEIAENGQWVLVEIKVRNNGTKEGTFIPDQQVLIVETGQTFNNEPASALAHADFKLGVSPIAPGGTQTGFFAFDIPIDARATELRLVGRLGESPVSVPLG